MLSLSNYFDPIGNPFDLLCLLIACGAANYLTNGGLIVQSIKDRDPLLALSILRVLAKDILLAVLLGVIVSIIIVSLPSWDGSMGWGLAWVCGLAFGAPIFLKVYKSISEDYAKPLGVAVLSKFVDKKGGKLPDPPKESKKPG